MTGATWGRYARPFTKTLPLRLLVAGWFALVGLGMSGMALAAPDVETLSSQIADSLGQLPQGKYQTVAFSRVRQAAGGTFDVDRLINSTNVKIVRAGRLRVVDRSRLQLILKEQAVQLQDFVSAQKYQELGKLLGVDLFIYGTVYRDGLVLKAIDVQTSAIAWADSFAITDSPTELAQLRVLGTNTAASLRKFQARLAQAKIRLVSFWGIDTANLFPADEVMDQLSVAITQDGNFRVVDRENVQQLVAEQQLNQEAVFDEKNAKKLGELYGVDGFIYGSMARGTDGVVVATLNLLNIYNGVIEWADEIRLQDSAGGTQMASGPAAPPGMVYIPAGPFIMGTNTAGDAAPAHQVNLNAYFIDSAEVSNADYLKFVVGKGHRPPALGWSGSMPIPGTEDLPVVGIGWEDAGQYCRSVGKRLPQEAEWEKAARGTAGQNYPWSTPGFSPGFAVTRESGKKKPDPVQIPGRDVSPYGVKHMAGNVREWVQDVFQPYPGGVPNNPGFNRERVVRGGSWATDQRPAAAWFRGSSAPNAAWPDVGFRCARSAN